MLTLLLLSLFAALAVRIAIDSRGPVRYSWFPVRLGWKRKSAGKFFAWHGWEISSRLVPGGDQRTYGQTLHIGAFKVYLGKRAGDNVPCSSQAPAAVLALFLAVLFAPAVALAQDAAPAAPGWLSPVLQYLVAPMIPLLGVAFLALVGKLVAYLHSREKDGKAFAVLAQVADVAATVAAKVEAVERAAMPGVLADGKVTSEEGKQLAALALAQLKASLSTDVLAALPKVVGTAGVDSYLAAKLEQVNSAQSAAPASPS